jgi:integrase
LAKLRLDEITNQHAAQFEAQHSRYSASTINQALRTLRRAKRLAEEWGEVVRAPKITLAKGERQRERIVTEEEFNRYIIACRQPWRDAAILIYCLGLGPSEVYTLRLENISLTEQGFLQITQGKSKAARRILPLLVPASERVAVSATRAGIPERWLGFPDRIQVRAS